jgi:hypothetical protein
MQIVGAKIAKICETRKGRGGKWKTESAKCKEESAKRKAVLSEFL